MLVALLVACGNDKRSVRTFLTTSRLESALSSRDSSSAYLRHTKGLTVLTDEDRARLGLLNIIDDHNNDRRPENDSTAHAVLNHYANRDDEPLRLLSEICAAMVYNELNESDKAVRLYTKAEQTASNDASDAVLYQLYTQWGWAISGEKPYSEALSKFKKAEHYARRNGNPKGIVHAIDLQGWQYFYSNEYAKALHTFDAAIDTANRYGKINIAPLLKSKGTAMELSGHHAAALPLINEAIARTHNTDTLTLFSIKGSILTKLGQLDSARIYIERGRQMNHPYQKATYYNDLVAIDVARGDYRSAYEHKERFAQCLDSFYSQNHYQELVKIQKLYNYSLITGERNRYALESQRKGIVIVLLVIAAVMAVSIVTFLYRRQRRRLHRAIQMKEELLSKTLSQIKDYNYELMRSKQESQEKEMELLRNISRKDEQLEQLSQEQQRLRQQIFRTDEVIRKIEDVKRMNEGRKITEAQQIALSADERQNMIASTNLCYGGFADRLSECFDTLTTDDLCLCCLLKMGASTQDQCFLLGTSDATLRKRKYRLKNKKMGLGDKFDTLDDFIRTF